RGSLDRSWAIALAFVAVAGALLTARSVVLSGYPLYPSTQLDVFVVDWKIPAAVADAEAVVIRAWARGIHAVDPPETFADAAAYPISRWLPVWVEHWPTLDRFFLPMLATSLGLFPIALACRPLRRFQENGNRPALVLLAAVAVPASVFWFWQAP